MKPKPLFTPDYADFLTEVKGRIQTARTAAGRAVNRELILLYWDIGRGIVERQKELGWGESVIEQLAKDLEAAFPGIRGFSPRNLRDMRRFFLAYADKSIWRPLVAKLPHDPFLPQAAAQDAAQASGGEMEIWRQPAAKLKSGGLAEYQLQPRLPSEFKGKLPTAKQLADAVRAALPGKKAK